MSAPVALPVSLVSIPHTGTKFTEYVLLAMGCDVRHAHFHATGVQNPRPWLHEDAKVVVPWREPDKAAKSARKRGEEPRPLAEFAELLEWSLRPNVHLFEIEPTDRAKELAALAAFVGAEVPEIEWTPVNAFQGAA